MVDEDRDFTSSRDLEMEEEEMEMSNQEQDDISKPMLLSGDAA